MGQQYLWDAEHDDLDALKRRVAKGKDITGSDEDGRNALHHACLGRASIETIEWLLANGFDADSEDKRGFTPVLIAAAKGYLTLLQLLHRRGFNLYAMTNFQYDALLVCISNSGDFTTVEWLLNNGFAAKGREGACIAPILLAAEENRSEIIQLLLLHGATTQVYDDERRGIWYYALRCTDTIKMIDFLLDIGLGIEDKGSNETTPLVAAARWGTLKEVKALVKRGAQLTTADMHQETALHWATVNPAGVAIVEWLLSQNLSIESMSLYGTPLMKAAEFGYKPMVQYLIHCNANVFASRLTRGNALHLAVQQHGNTACVELLLEQKIPIDVLEDEHNTPFLLAAAAGKVCMLDYLHRKGANVLARNRDGSTALHMFALRANADVSACTWLLDHGLDINAKDQRGMTPLMCAAQRGSLQMVQLLVEKGAHVELESLLGITALHYAQLCGKQENCSEYLKTISLQLPVTELFLAASRGDTSALKKHVSDGENLNQKRYGAYILHWAVRSGKVSAVKYLISQKVKLDVVDELGERPICWAIDLDNYEVMRLLVDAGADIHMLDPNGETLLYRAVRSGNSAIVFTLIKQGCDVRIIGRSGISVCDYAKNNQAEHLLYYLDVTPLREAIKENDMERIQSICTGNPLALKQRTQDGNAMHWAAKYAKNEDIIDWLIAQGLEVDDTCETNKTPFLSAAKYGKIEGLTFLKARGANVKAVSTEGFNALQLAIKYNASMAVINWLLELGIMDVLAGHLPDSPLQLAIAKNRLDVLERLKQLGVDVVCHFDSKETALHLAVVKAKASITVWLLDNQCDIEACDGQGNTPLLCATESGADEQVELLLSRGAKVDVVNKLGQNVMHLVRTVKCFMQLLNNGLTLGHRGPRGNTVFLSAAEKALDLLMDCLLNETDLLDQCNYFHENALHLVVQQANCERSINFLLNKGLDIECEGQYARTAFLYAAHAVNWPAMKILAENGANMQVRDALGYSALHLVAMRGGRLEMVRWLMRRGSYINARAHHGITPLMVAAGYGQYALVKLLIRLGASVSLCDDFGNNALHYAARFSNHIPTIEYLLLHGFDIERQGQQDRRPLHWAVIGGHEEVVAMLLSKGVASHAVDARNYNVLHLACLLGHTALAQRFGQDSHLMNARGEYGRTPWLCAAYTGQVALMPLLVQLGAEVHVVDDEGCNAFHLVAARDCEAPTEQWLLDLGLKIESIAQDGKTPHLYAGQSGRMSSSKVLADHGANKLAKDHAGNTALTSFALQHKSETIAEALTPEAKEVALTEVPTRAQLSISINQLHCPISRQIMADPYSTIDGYTYEFDEIKQWLENNPISPATGLKLESKTLVPNLLAKQIIESYLSDKLMLKLSGEVYLPQRFKQALNQAVHSANVQQIVQALARDPRLYFEVLADGQSLFHLLAVIPTFSDAHVRLMDDVLEHIREYQRFDEVMQNNPRDWQPPFLYHCLFYHLQQRNVAQLRCYAEMQLNLVRDVSARVTALIKSSDGPARGNTYLWVAVESDFLALTRLLVEQGVDMTGCNAQGDTVLMVAVRRKNQPMIAILVEAIVQQADNTVLFEQALELAKAMDSEIFTYMQSVRQCALDKFQDKLLAVPECNMSEERPVHSDNQGHFNVSQRDPQQTQLTEHVMGDLFLPLRHRDVASSASGETEAAADLSNVRTIVSHNKFG